MDHEHMESDAVLEAHVSSWAADAADEDRRRRVAMEKELASARTRVEAARYRMATRRADMSVMLRTEVAQAQALVEALERDHQTLVTAIRTEAERAMADIVNEARREADQMLIAATANHEERFG